MAPVARALSTRPLLSRPSATVFLLRSRGRLRSRPKIEREVPEPLPLLARVFPAVAIRADVPKPDRRVGPDRVAALPRPLAKRKILGQIPVALIELPDERLKERDHRPPKHLVAHRQPELLLDHEINLPPHVQKPCSGVGDVREPAPTAKDDRGRAGADVAGEARLALLGVDPASDRQAMIAELVHRIGMEADVGIDPERLLKTFHERIGRELVATMGRGYVDSVADFQGKKWGGVDIKPGDITARGLDLAVPAGATAAQQQALQSLITYGAQNGVTVRIVVVP